MLTSLLLSSVSGLLLTVGFPKPAVACLSWVALIPLLMAVRNTSPRNSLMVGYWCGLVHYLSALYWIWIAVHRYGGVAAPVAAVVLVILCAYLALYPAVFALIASRWQKHPFLWVLGLPGAWVALEFIRAHFITGFPWASLGYSQTPFLELIQVADLGGVFLVSWLVVLGSTALLSLLERGKAWWTIFILIAAVVGAWQYGVWRIEDIGRRQDGIKPWTVAVLQGNIDQSRKWDPAFQQEIMARYKSLSERAIRDVPSPELMVWPETSAPFFYGIEDQLTAQLNRMVESVGVPFLFGSPGVTMEGGEPRLQNRAYLVNASGRLEGLYAKQHLVPFGEYVPLKKILFFVDRLVQAAGDFVPGKDGSPLVSGNRPFGVLICYEDIFPELARDEVLRGASALINITNDAWYGDSSAPYQHLEMARWRAIEFRVPLIRAANTGISAIFEASGKSCGTIPLDTEGFLTVSVRPLRTSTLYAKWGDAFAWLCLLTTAGGLLYSVYSPGIRASQIKGRTQP